MSFNSYPKSTQDNIKGIFISTKEQTINFLIKFPLVFN